MDKVSIIVPIYNAEKYLSACLDSIIYQTYKNLEIILINDGSLDDSISICKQYIKKDNRIKLIDDKNHGVSHARNKGIKEATGKYILFIDADDIIKKKYIEILVKEINKDINLDMAVCSYEEVNLNNNKRKKYNIDNSKIILLTGILKKDYYLIKDFLNTPWGKLYKLNIIKKYDIMFPDKHKIAEDQIFNYQYYLYVRKYIFVNNDLYIYMHRNNNSLVLIKNKETFSSDIFNFKMKKKFFEDIGVENKDELLSDWSIVLANKYTIINEKDNYKDLKKRMNLICNVFSPKVLWSNGLKKFLATVFLKYGIFLPFYLKNKIRNKRYGK